MKSIKQAVILAGGKGIRLRPLTLKTPKPMIKIHGRPFLEYIIELLKKNGIVIKETTYSEHLSRLSNRHIFQFFKSKLT